MLIHFSNRFRLLLPTVMFLWINGQVRAEDFNKFLQPLFNAKCVKCHGKKGKVKGKVNLLQIRTASQFLKKPKLIKDMIEAIDANDMPPEKEPRLNRTTRLKLLSSLRTMLREATTGKKTKPVPYRRLNRFQYNNVVKDLFQLNKDVFRLPEKMMTRHGNYFNPKSTKMPDRVDAACLSLNRNGGFKDVAAFPQDLRALHGFDNQANQLTLSPLLLESFLQLSVSILNSPDFQGSCGIWNEFFKGSAGDGRSKTAIARRLKPFLTKAFRSSVDAATVSRYAEYALSQMKQGRSFTDSMKKVASAALSSPLFLYRYQGVAAIDRQYALASNLSFFLWGSSPDEELLALAGRGQLSSPATLKKTIDRMLTDKKVERFLDSFPAQWMQLETILAVAPDPKKHRFYNVDKKNSASLQMVLEPLLLFDAVFIEDRPLVELLSPTFSYQSDFLKKWYALSSKPQLHPNQTPAKRRERELARKSLVAKITKAQRDLETLLKPVKAGILSARKRKAGLKRPVDLKPYAAWEFNGNLKASVSSLELKAHGKISYSRGMVVLKNAYLQTKNLPIDLNAKTMEVWCTLNNITQRGGGVMTIQGRGDHFDSIVYGERAARHWISGSNRHRRTLDFKGSTPETSANTMLHLVMVYQANGTTTLYRNGKPYGKSYRKGSTTFAKNQTSVVFGLRHLPPGGNKFLSVTLDKARLYNRALTPAEVAALSSGVNLIVSDEDLNKALSSFQKRRKAAFDKTISESKFELTKYLSPEDRKKQAKINQKKIENGLRNALRSRTFQRVAATDPRFGGIITNAATLSMTSLPKRTRPIGRGAWIIEVIFNDPPPPPPNDVPPLNENNGSKKLTIRERFAKHRSNSSCAGCHSRLDPLGFALENFDVTGQWRDKYENGRDVDASGTLIKKHKFAGVVEFKESLVKEKKRFAKAFTGHLLRFALSRELRPADSLIIDDIVSKAEKEDFKLKSIIREVILCDPFLKSN